MKKARLKALGLAYLSPQNKSLAQSFRYMRNKPTIIAFKTPSLENCEQRQSQASMGSMSKYQLKSTSLCRRSKPFAPFQLCPRAFTHKGKPRKAASASTGTPSSEAPRATTPNTTNQ